MQWAEKLTVTTLIDETASSTLNSSTLKSKSSPTDSVSMFFEFYFKGRKDNELITYSLSVGYHQVRPENKDYAEKETKNIDDIRATSVSSFLETPSQELPSFYVRSSSARSSLATSTSATSTHSTTKQLTDLNPTSLSTSSSTSSKRPCVLHEA